MKDFVKSLQENMYFLLTVKCLYGKVAFSKYIPIEVKDTDNFHEIVTDKLATLFDGENVQMEFDHFEVVFSNEVTGVMSWEQVSKADYLCLVKRLKD